MSEEEPMGVMTTEECWDMLRANEFGRLAFHLGGEVHLTPVNYAVDHDTLLFRTAEGSKLLGVEMNSDVAFEIDEFDEHHARSVVVRGVARHLGEDEEHRAEAELQKLTDAAVGEIDALVKGKEEEILTV